MLKRKGVEIPMADTILSNIAGVLGTYDETQISANSDAAVTQLVNILITKAADKALWVDGILTYTVTINNNASDPYTGITLSDTLDPILISLVSNSVLVNGSAGVYTYNSETGALSVEIPDMDPEDEVIVTFQVRRK
jgi:uncharacterized repeat protein (TIGR01451 family)